MSLDNNIPSDELEKLYVDLIHQKTGHFASFTPTIQAKIGDYGFIESVTSRFVASGNLFTDYPELTHLVGDFVKTPLEDCSIVATGRGGSMRTLDESFLKSFITDATRSFTTGWTFDAGQHAALVLIDPVLVRLPEEQVILDFLAKNPERLKEFMSSFILCTELHQTTSYAFVVTDGQPGNIILAFSPDSLPDALESKEPLLKNRIEDHPWTVGINGGFFSTGRFKPELELYYPLLSLKKLRMHNGVLIMDNASLPT